MPNPPNTRLADWDWECPTCGALIHPAHRELHEVWHEETQGDKIRPHRL